MCGICGIINFNGEKATKDQLQKMTNGMVHRGPDDEGIFISNNIGLGMRRLSIIDLETGHQPISNEDKSIWTILNGEIYNHIELRKELISKGHIFKTNSDTEVIVHLYEEYGYSLLEKINGMFALAILDKKKNLLLVARDRLGIKPLFYTNVENKFIFSSDLNSISKTFKFEVNPSSILKYLGLSYVPTPNTIYKKIKKLPPAHYLVIQKNKISIKKYWKINSKNKWTGDLNEAKEEFQSLINDSLQLRFRSDVPLGLFLSGGVDSSGLVALASSMGYENLNTLTINFENKEGQDSSFASIVSEQYNTQHKSINFSLTDFKNELDDLIPFLDEPISDSAMIPTFYLSKISSSQGIKVLLSGAGGDEIFGGYSRHNSPRIGSPRWVAEKFPNSISNMIGTIWEIFQPQRGIRAKSAAVAYGLECSGADISFLGQIIDSSINDILESSSGPFLGLNKVDKDYNYTYQRMNIDINNYLIDDVLSLTDKATMAASVEGRVPLLDHRLVEFCFSLPKEMNHLGNKPKGLYIDLLKNKLPTNLLNRSKEGFNAPTSSWLVNDSVNSKVKNEILDTFSPILEGIINKNSIEKILMKNQNIRTAGNSLFGIYILNRWLNEHCRNSK